MVLFFNLNKPILNITPTISTNLGDTTKRRKAWFSREGDKGGAREKKREGKKGEKTRERKKENDFFNERRDRRRINKFFFSFCCCNILPKIAVYYSKVVKLFNYGTIGVTCTLLFMVWC